jgi:hypothetical protein
MTTETTTQPANYQRQVIAILQRLPPERGLQLLAFARFLAYETFQTTELDFLEEDVDLEVTPTAADERWDELLASEAGQLALDQLADEALADLRAGKARPMTFTPDGEIAPR